MPQLTSLLIQSGIPEQAVAWLFILPVAVTFVIAVRQVVGIKGLGIATPLLIGFAVASLGIQAGVILFTVVLAGNFAARLILARVRLLSLPKAGLIIISAVLVLSAILPFLPYRENINLPLAGFSLAVIVLSMEQFSAVFRERSSRRAFTVLLETAVVSLPVSYLATWKYLEDLVLAYPIFVLIGVTLFTFLLGKWTGLRIREFVRFKNIIFK